MAFRELLDELAPDVLFATEAEWELLGGAYLTAPLGVLKRGARGCTVFTEPAPPKAARSQGRASTAWPRTLPAGAKLDFAAVEAEVVDPTGAGDALAAGFLVGLEAPPAEPAAPGEDPGRLRRPVGGSLEEAARRGLDAAARCVANVGSLP